MLYFLFHDWTLVIRILFRLNITVQGFTASFLVTEENNNEVNFPQNKNKVTCVSEEHFNSITKLSYKRSLFKKVSEAATLYETLPS